MQSNGRVVRPEGSLSRLPLNGYIVGRVNRSSRERAFRAFTLWAEHAMTSIGKTVGRALPLVLWLGCGGGGGSAGPDGVPRAATVLSLDAKQSAALCDWINASVGGYGSIDNCAGGGARHADSTQQSCVSGFSGVQACPSLTVGAVEDCINAIGGDLCLTETAPACLVLVLCESADGANSGG